MASPLRGPRQPGSVLPLSLPLPQSGAGSSLLVQAAQPTGSHSEATLALGAGSVSRSRGSCQGQRIPREGANHNRPKRGRHETGRGHPIPWASLSRRRSFPQDPGVPKSVCACRPLPFGRRNVKTEVMENFVHGEEAVEPSAFPVFLVCLA